MTAADLRRVAREVAGCRTCPRLVAWRDEVAVVKRAAFRDEEYWSRGVPGFGDPKATVLVLGLAPAAHGANRTGRMFTGDRSGDWLYRAMYRAGFASQPTSVDRADGLHLTGAWVTSGVKCAPPGNHPLPVERDACRPFLQREIAALRSLRVVVCLGTFAYEAACAEFGVRPRPRFGHGVEVPAGELTIVCSFHPSQQNTFTGRLSEPMLDSVFERARELVGDRAPRRPASGERGAQRGAGEADGGRPVADAGHAEEGVDLPAEADAGGGDAGGVQPRRVRLTLVPQWVELGGDDEAGGSGP
jgi:uracil-DNA glycosylase family 4